MGLRQQKRDALRRRILEVSGRLFRSRGFDQTTVDEIAAAVGVSRQTFFNYFPSKERALRELGFAWLAEQGQRSIEAGRSGAERALMPRLREVLTAQLRAIEADRDFMRLVFTRAGLFFPTGPDVDSADDEPRLQRTRGAFDLVAAGIRAAQRRGELRSDVDPHQAAEIYTAVFYVTTRLWLTGYWKGGETLEARMSKAIDVLMDGLRPRGTAA